MMAQIICVAVIIALIMIIVMWACIKAGSDDDDRFGRG